MAEPASPGKKEMAAGDAGPAEPGTEETAADPTADTPAAESAAADSGDVSTADPEPEATAAEDPADAPPSTGDTTDDGSAEPAAAVEAEPAAPAAAGVSLAKATGPTAAVEDSAADPAPADAVPPAAPGPASSGPGGGGRGVVLAVVGSLLSVLLVFLVVCGVLLALDVRENGNEDDDRKAALAAAQQAMVNLSTIKAETAEQDVQRVLDSATGQFSAEFQSNKDQFVEIVKQAQVNSTAQVDAAGVSSENDGKYRVLIAMTSTIKNASLPDGELRPFRMAVTMTEQNGDWLVDRVEYIQ